MVPRHARGILRRLRNNVDHDIASVGRPARWSVIWSGQKAGSAPLPERALQDHGEDDEHLASLHPRKG